MAAAFIERSGSRVVERNVFVARDEIDIVYVGAHGFVAVEVKTVLGESDPFDAINDEKIHRIRRAVAGYRRPIVAIELIGVTINDLGVEIRWLRSVR